MDGDIMGANPILSIYKFPCLWKLVALRVLREVDEDESGPELVLLDEPHALDLELPLGAHPDELVKVEAAEVERDVGEGVVHRVERLLPALGVVAGKVLLRRSQIRVTLSTNTKSKSLFLVLCML